MKRVDDSLEENVSSAEGQAMGQAFAALDRSAIGRLSVQIAEHEVWVEKGSENLQGVYRRAAVSEGEARREER